MLTRIMSKEIAISSDNRTSRRTVTTVGGNWFFFLLFLALRRMASIIADTG